MKSLDEKFKVPKDIEQSVPILGIHPVDLSFSVGMFAFGIVMKSMMVSIIAMVVTLYVLGKLRKGAKRGYSQHYLWRIGVTSIDSTLTAGFPHPSKNDFIN